MIALGSLFAVTAAGGEEREPIRLQYTAQVPGCPDARTFLSEVLSRSTRIRSAPDFELARVLRVTIVRGQRPSECKGDISLVRDGDRTPVRFSSSGACDDVVYALAQFAALSLDPSVKSQPTYEPLPENPYLTWRGPVAEPLPENPYRSTASVAEPRALRENPHPNEEPRALRENPYSNAEPRALRENPYSNAE